ncbi:unnamed protein product [Darwinula stevensoni]|uniref:MKRN2 opposite strand protein n=1 Tax=Darwinula stevensoni TaxID=69355 RepID=A0A7R8ZYF0_9CRUS|nr:unnamed protein product [Darwinula stevensoni]CAG0880350.1 unnamed protein product [Darwinula stevensoni]
MTNVRPLKLPPVFSPTRSSSMEMSGTDPGILCFQHCDKKTKIFCFSVPSTCPVCGCDLVNSPLRIPPFRIPYPFGRARDFRCAVVIKPTQGSFLKDYKNSSDLHIGVTDSRGEVVEYDRNGVKRGDWEHCLPVPIFPKKSSSLSLPQSHSFVLKWDSTLQSMATSPLWTKDKYMEKSHNCYAFTLSFLGSLKLERLNGATSNPTEFCQRFIVPQTTAAGKYITLYRRLSETGVVVHR